MVSENDGIFQIIDKSYRRKSHWMEDIGKLVKSQRDKYTPQKNTYNRSRKKSGKFIRVSKKNVACQVCFVILCWHLIIYELF